MMDEFDAGGAEIDVGVDAEASGCLVSSPYWTYSSPGSEGSTRVVHYQFHEDGTGHKFSRLQDPGYGRCPSLGVYNEALAKGKWEQIDAVTYHFSHVDLYRGTEVFTFREIYECQQGVLRWVAFVNLGNNVSDPNHTVREFEPVNHCDPAICDSGSVPSGSKFSCE